MAHIKCSPHTTSFHGACGSLIGGQRIYRRRHQIKAAINIDGPLPGFQTKHQILQNIGFDFGWIQMALGQAFDIAINGLGHSYASLIFPAFSSGPRPHAGSLAVFDDVPFAHSLHRALTPAQYDSIGLCSSNGVEDKYDPLILIRSALTELNPSIQK